MSKDIVSIIQNERTLSWSQKLGCVVRLSLPSMLAQISYIAMEYIDAAMVGGLGAVASASIGLVAPTLWLLYGLCNVGVQGFSVQVAQFIGANELDEARNTFRQCIVYTATFAILIALIGYFIGDYVPLWLGGSAELQPGASAYFTIFMCAMPIIQLRMIGSAMLQSSGNMKVPSFFNAFMCLLDVVFNCFFIFPEREAEIFGTALLLPGMDMGVKGAALGSVVAEFITAVILISYTVCRSKYLKQKVIQKTTMTLHCLRSALNISIPMGAEQCAMSSAYVALVLIIAPLGNIAIAANSFGVTAEAFCYMPGLGISVAAATLVGQSIGAKKPRFARDFAWCCIGLGMVVMGIAGAIMYVICPWVMAFLTPDKAVQALSVDVLRVELWAEPLFAAAMVGAGALRGARDTFIPSIIALVSMWGVRISLAFFLVADMGLMGAWIAMCIELCVRGLLFIFRVYTKKWSKVIRV